MATNLPRVLGIIPARAGSKGVPNKNFRSLAGKPLIHYTCASAAQSKMLSTVVISTDHENGAMLCKPYSEFQTVLTRPTELALDHTPMIEVISQVTQHYEQLGQYFDYICLLQPTCPFRREGLIDEAILYITHQDADSLVTVRSVPAKYNPHWIYENKNGYMALSTGESRIITRRQDLPETWYRDGQLYIARIDLIRQGILLGKKLIGLQNNGSPDVNIDTNDDWILTENIAQHGAHL